jgi:hypothetical protein
MKKFWVTFFKRILPILIGAAVGYAYYRFVGCQSGSCPLTSNPYIMVMYGTLAGLFVALPGKPKTPQKEEVKE